VPCAVKKIIRPGKKILYAATGIGIPSNREKNACLLMEDVGEIPLNIYDRRMYKEMILYKLVESIFQIGGNQRVGYNEIYVGIKSLNVEEGEYGCAMSVAPYFKIARKALPPSPSLYNMGIHDWENYIINNKFF
jgi:hypothetical protein